MSGVRCLVSRGATLEARPEEETRDSSRSFKEEILISGNKSSKSLKRTQIKALPLSQEVTSEIRLAAESCEAGSVCFLNYDILPIDGLGSWYY